MIWERDEITTDRGTEWIGSYSYTIEEEDKPGIAKQIAEQILENGEITGTTFEIQVTTDDDFDTSILEELSDYEDLVKKEILKQLGFKNV